MAFWVTRNAGARRFASIGTLNQQYGMLRALASFSFNPMRASYSELPRERRNDGSHHVVAVENEKRDSTDSPQLHRVSACSHPGITKPCPSDFAMSPSVSAPLDLSLVVVQRID